MLGAEKLSTHISGTLESALGALRMDKVPLDPTSLKTPTNPDAPSHKEVEYLIDEKIRLSLKNLEGNINDAVEETVLDSLTFELSDVDYNKKNGMYLLLQNVFAEVVKRRLHTGAYWNDSFKGGDERRDVRQLMKASIGVFFDDDEILNELVQILRKDT